MSFSLIPIDSTIISNHVSIVFRTDPAPESEGFPLGEMPLPLQFPPKITDDSKTANWNDIDQCTYEPIPIFKGSSARRITIEIVYIVTGSALPGQTSGGTVGRAAGVATGAGAGTSNAWTTEYIAKCTKQIKAYFYRSIAAGKNIPVVLIRFYNHVGSGSSGPQAAFRLTDVGITHGETLINDSQGVFPLFTKVRMTALLTTQTKTGDEVKPKFDVNVPAKPKAVWY